MSTPDWPNYEVKDSGKRQEFDGGMQRDVTEGKTRFDLCFDGPMFERYAIHLTKGAVKYQPRNWLKAEGSVELERFRESAVRHFYQWLKGDEDEDHAAAVWFNINGAEYVKAKMNTNEYVEGLIARAQQPQNEITGEAV